ncbi:MAG: hypothetical protein U0234_15835 [Sandaracinus sp.]
MPPLAASNLDSAHLDSAHLDSAHLDSAHLDSAHLDSAHLDSEHLDSAHLDSSRLDSAHLEAPGSGEPAREPVCGAGSCLAGSRLDGLHAWAPSVLLVALLIGCGGAPTPPSTPPAAEPEARTFLPNGASLFVLARPRELYEADASAAILRTVLADAQLDAIRVHYGIDVHTLDRLAFARYEEGSAQGDVLVLQGPFRAEVVVAEIAHRMVPRESETRGTTGARAGGVLHGTRLDVLALGPHTVVVVTGPPSLAERVTRTADGSVPPLVAGPIQQSLARRPAPFLAMRPVPLGLDGTSGVGLLLSEEETLLVAAAPEGSSAIRVSVDLTGGFPPTAEQNFRQLAVSLAQSPMGTALGLRSALGTLEVEASPTAVSLTATLSAAEVARGLHLTFGAEIAEALEADAPSTTN